MPANCGKLCAAGIPAPVSVFVVLFTGQDSRKSSRTPRKKSFAHARFYIDKPGDPLPERLRGRFKKKQKIFSKNICAISKPEENPGRIICGRPPPKRGAPLKSISMPTSKNYKSKSMPTFPERVGQIQAINHAAKGGDYELIGSRRRSIIMPKKSRQE